MINNPPLGWIPPSERTQQQADAHAHAVALMPRFAIPGAAPPPKGTKIILTDFWKKPEVVADVGFEFNGFHQLTGSCVGASAGNAVFTLAAVQRMLAANPTKAFVPWWPFPYGRTRYNEGDRGQGEGAIDSVMAKTLQQEGVVDAAQQGLPTFDRSDGLTLTERIEMQYSDGAASVNTTWLNYAKDHPVGTAAPLNSTDDIMYAVVNGYPVLDGCEMYTGNGKVVGSGDTAYVQGQYDGRGGHSTCFLGFWDHPNDGPLFLYSNQWPTSTYPKDPAGAGRCCVWMKESVVAKLFSQYGGDNGETVALSNLNWFPAQPALLSWFV